MRGIAERVKGLLEKDREAFEKAEPELLNKKLHEVAGVGKNAEEKSVFQEFDGSMALRDLAELEVLDYICQNVDRHDQNMLFEFSEDGKKCVAIHGIDNDISFGTKKMGEQERVQNSRALKNIHVISERMAQRILAARPAALQNTLSGQGLDEKERDAAMNRLATIKKRIQSGQIQVLKDEEWANKTLKDFGENNIFEMVQEAFDEKLEFKIDEKGGGHRGCGKPVHGEIGRRGLGSKAG